eukprot:UC1_evm1s666
MTQQYPRVAASLLGSDVVVLASEGHSSDPRAHIADILRLKNGHVMVSSSNFSVGRSNKCATTYRDLAIFAGGTAMRGAPKSSNVDVYNATSGTWSLKHMSIGRDLLGCASAGPYTVFAGGSAPQVNQSETAEVDVWNHVTGVWTRARLSQPRKKPEAVTAGTKIIIAGGEIAKPGGSGGGSGSGGL